MNPINKQDRRHKPWKLNHAREQYYRLIEEDAEMRKPLGRPQRVAFWATVFIIGLGMVLMFTDYRTAHPPKEILRSAQEYREILSDIKKEIPKEIK